MVRLTWTCSPSCRPDSFFSLLRSCVYQINDEVSLPSSSAPTHPLARAL